MLQSGMYPYCLRRAARTISSLWACRKTLKAGEAAAKSRREEVVMQAARASCEVEERAAKAKTWVEPPHGMVSVYLGGRGWTCKGRECCA